MKSKGIRYDKMEGPLVTVGDSIIVKVEKHNNKEVLCGLFDLKEFKEVLPCIYSRIRLISNSNIISAKMRGKPTERIKVKSLTKGSKIRT